MLEIQVVFQLPANLIANDKNLSDYIKLIAADVERGRLGGFIADGHNKKEHRWTVELNKK